jgi:hypothetical protein
MIARACWLLCAGLLWASLFACDTAHAQSKSQRKPSAGASADRGSGSARSKARKQKRDKRNKSAAAAEAESKSSATETAAAAPEQDKPAASESKPAPAAALPADVHTEGDTQVKVMEFSGLDIEGQLKTPQMLYFLNRMRAEFGRPRLPHRSFMPELEQSTKEKAF